MRSLNEKSIEIMHILLSLECGGAEKVAVNLINRMNRRGFGFSVCLLDRVGILKEDLPPDVSINCMNRREGIDYLLPFKLAKIIRKRNPDVIHIHNSTCLLYGAAAARLARCPNIILTQHGVSWDERKARIVLKQFGKIMKRGIAVSENIVDYLLNVYGMDSKRIELVINGIDENRFKPDKEKRDNARNKFDCQNDFVIGHVARLAPEKDQITLLKAFKEIIGHTDRVKLFIVGGGPEKELLEAAAADMKINQKIYFTGIQKDVPYFMNIFDVFVLSSIREGTSLTLLEAMAAELPIVATNVGGNSDVVHHKKNGLIVSPMDPEAMSKAIIDVISDPERRQRMGLEGRSMIIKKYGLQRMTDNYCRIYRLISGK